MCSGSKILLYLTQFLKPRLPPPRKPCTFLQGRHVSLSVPFFFSKKNSSKEIQLQRIVCNRASVVLPAVSATSLDCLTFGNIPLEEVKVRSDHMRPFMVMLHVWSEPLKPCWDCNNQPGSLEKIKDSGHFLRVVFIYLLLQLSIYSEHPSRHKQEVHAIIVFGDTETKRTCASLMSSVATMT